MVLTLRTREKMTDHELGRLGDSRRLECALGRLAELLAASHQDPDQMPKAIRTGGMWYSVITGVPPEEVKGKAARRIMKRGGGVPTVKTWHYLPPQYLKPPPPTPYIPPKQHSKDTTPGDKGDSEPLPHSQEGASRTASRPGTVRRARSSKARP